MPILMLALNVALQEELSNFHVGRRRYLFNSNIKSLVISKVSLNKHSGVVWLAELRTSRFSTAKSGLVLNQLLHSTGGNQVAPSFLRFSLSIMKRPSVTCNICDR